MASTEIKRNYSDQGHFKVNVSIVSNLNVVLSLKEDNRRVHTGVLLPVLFPFSSDSAWNFAFTPKGVLSSDNFYPHF